MTEPKVQASRTDRWLITANVGYLLSSNLFAGGLLYVVNIHLARTLAVVEFGSLNFLITLVIIAFQVSELGLNIEIQRDAAHAGRRDAGFFQAALLVRAILSVAMIAISYLVVMALPDTSGFSTAVVSLLLVSACLDSLSQSLVSRLYGSENMRRTAAISAVRALTMGVLVFSFAQSQSLWLIAFIYAVASAARLAMALYTLRADLTGAVWKASFKSFSIIKSSWPYGMIGLFSVLSSRIDISILGVLKDQATVGQYSIAMMAMTVGSMVSASYTQSIWPSLVRSADSAASFHNTYRQMLKIPFAGALIVGILGWLLAEPLVMLIFTARYADSIESLRVMCVATGAMFLVATAGAAINAIRLPKLTMAYAGMIAALKAILCFTLIPTYGSLGAAWATLLSYTIGFGVLHMINIRISPPVPLK